MNEPLNSFANRIIDNQEVSQFIYGLLEKGVSPEQLKKTIKDWEHSRKFDPWKEALRYKFRD